MKVQIASYLPIQVTSLSVYAPTPAAAVDTIDTVADVNGSLNGTYLHCFGANNEVIHTFWIDASSAEVTDVTLRADVAGDLRSKFWYLNSPAGFTDYYVWYSTEAADITAVTMRADVSNDLAGKFWLLNTPSITPDYYVWYSTEIAEIQDVTVVADVAGSLNDTWFHLYSANDAKHYYVWYNVAAGGTDPQPDDSWEPIEVGIVSGELIADVADKTRIAVDAYSDFGAVDDNIDTVTITNVAVGSATDASNGTATPGFTYAVTTQGVDVATDPGNTGLAVGKTGAKVVIVTGDTATAVGTATELVIEALLEFTSSEAAGVITINNVHIGAIVPHSDGDIGGAFSVAAATTLGEDVAADPSTFGPLNPSLSNVTGAKVLISRGDTATAVGIATELIVEALAEFTSTEAVGVVSVTNVNKGSVVDIKDGNILGDFAVSVTTLGVPVLDPSLNIHGLTKNTTISPVVILPNESADNVAAQLRIDIAAEAEFVSATGATNQVIITNAAVGEADLPRDGKSSTATGFTYANTTPGITGVPAAGAGSINFFRIVGYMVNGGGVQQGNQYKPLLFERTDVDMIVPESQILRIWES